MNERTNSYKSAAKSSHTWTPQEECLLVDIWESNFDKLKNTKTKKQTYYEMQQELLLHNFDVSLDDIKRKIYNLTRRYKSAFFIPQQRKVFSLFDRLHLFLPEPKNQMNNNNNSQIFADQNGSGKGEINWSVDDAQEYISCETNDLSLDFESRIETFQLKQTQNISPIDISCESTLNTLKVQQPHESKEEIIDLDCEPTDAEQTKQADQQNIVNSIDFSSFKEKQFPTTSLDILHGINTFQAVEPVQHFSTLKNFNCEPLLNQFQPIRTEINSFEKPPSKRRKRTENKTPEPKIDFTGAMLEKLSSIDENLNRLIAIQESSAIKIYSESGRQTFVLTKLLEQEVQRTQLMERLLASNNELKQTLACIINPNM